MIPPVLPEYFSNKVLKLLIQTLTIALEEDGIDSTSKGIFSSADRIRAQIILKQQATIVGLPLIPLILELSTPTHTFSWKPLSNEGTTAQPGTIIAEIIAPAHHILKTERLILNMISHLSGIATLTKTYVHALEGTGVILLDTRKTLPGLRHLDKYAVLCGGGMNHRKTLEEFLLIKDTHIDAAGSITKAVAQLRKNYVPCPFIEVECRTELEVHEALSCAVNRIMLDNMSTNTLKASLDFIQSRVETEVSGGVTLNSIYELATCSKYKPTYISVGALTNAAPPIDVSLISLEILS